MSLYAKQMLVGPFGVIRENSPIPARIPKATVASWKKDGLVGPKDDAESLEEDDLEDDERLVPTIEQLNKMGKPKLAEVINDFQLDVSPDQKLPDLKAAVIAALHSPDSL